MPIKHSIPTNVTIKFYYTRVMTTARFTLRVLSAEIIAHVSRHCSLKACKASSTCKGFLNKNIGIVIFNSSYYVLIQSLQCPVGLLLHKIRNRPTKRFSITDTIVKLFEFDEQ